MPVTATFDGYVEDGETGFSNCLVIRWIEIAIVCRLNPGAGFRYV